MTTPSSNAQQNVDDIAIIADKIQQASRAQKRYCDRLSKLDELMGNTSMDLIESGDHLPRHMLQLRYDQIDVITALLHLNKSYCKALGISPLNTRESNLERALYAMGFDSLYHELHHLLHLVDKLEDVGNRLKEQSVDEKRRRKHLKQLTKALQESIKELQPTIDEEKLQEEQAIQHHKKHRDLESLKQLEHELHSVEELQAVFQFSVEQLTEALQRIPGLPKFGLVYNYIAGLEGPVSRFFQAKQNGVQQIMNLSKQFDPAMIQSLQSSQPRKEMLDIQAKLARTTKFFHH